MNESYLKQARANGVSTASEAELILGESGLTSAFWDMQELKRIIAEEKLAAVNAIDAKYADRIQEIEEQYAVQLAFSK